MSGGNQDINFDVNQSTSLRLELQRLDGQVGVNQRQP